MAGNFQKVIVNIVKSLGVLDTKSLAIFPIELGEVLVSFDGVSLWAAQDSFKNGNADGKLFMQLPRCSKSACEARQDSLPQGL